MSMACDVFAGQPGRSAARKSDAERLAPVTLATPSMRPTPVAAGFQPRRPGSVSRAAKLGSAAIAKGVMLSAMPLAVADLTKSRREILIGPRLYWRNSFFTRFVGIYWQQPLLAIYGRGCTRPAALRISIRQMSALGQKRKNSIRALDVRFAPQSGR